MRNRLDDITHVYVPTEEHKHVCMEMITYNSMFILFIRELGLPHHFITLLLPAALDERSSEIIQRFDCANSCVEEVRYHYEKHH